MSILRKKIEDELNSLDNQSMAAVYEHIRQINRMRWTSRKRRPVVPDISRVLELTAESRSNWAETVLADREDRL